MNKRLAIDDQISVDFNITNAFVSKSHVNGDIPLVDILDQEARLQLESLDLQLAFDYAFITDPPFLADIGSATIGINGMGFAVQFNTTHSSDAFEIGLLDLALEFVQPEDFVSFDGLNDLSYVITSNVNTLSSVFRNRLSSMIEQQLFTATINEIVNKVIATVPHDIEIKNTPYYLEGLFYKNINFVKHEFIQVALNTTFQSENHHYPDVCETVLPEEVETSKY